MGPNKEKIAEVNFELSILLEFVKRILKWGKTIQISATEGDLFPYGEEIDISSEVYRLYRFPKGESVMIKKPATLIIDERGIHYVIDKNEYSHTVPLGWIHLKFKVEAGKSHFYFQKKKIVEEKKFNSKENHVKKV